MGTYKPNDLVVLHSLRKRADLNGACGRVVYAKEDEEVAADRHAVQVQRADGSTETLGVKPTNLRLPKDRLAAIVNTQRPLPQRPLLASAGQPSESVKRHKVSPQRIRICSSNVPPGIARNAVKNGQQVLSGVEADPGGEQWQARVKTMAAQWSAARPDVILHQELHSEKLEQLHHAVGWRLRPVEPKWCCPISYNPDVLQPLFADRFVLGSAPNSFLPEGACRCKFGQWSYSACHCWPDDGEWRAGGATYAAFRFVDSPPARVDIVCVSVGAPVGCEATPWAGVALRLLVCGQVHLTDRKPDLRTRGAQEVLAPLLRLLRERFKAPVVCGGDFNMTKLQSSDKRNKNGGGVNWRVGAYDALVGSHARSYGEGESVEAAHVTNRKLLKLDLNNFLWQGADPDSDYEEDERPPPPVMVDTWEVARMAGTTQANGCRASTCHNWFGLYRGFQKAQVYSQGPGSNSIDVYHGEYEGEHRAVVKGTRPVFGSARFIDWILVDFASLKEERVKVLGAEVHTAPGTRDHATIRRLPGAWGGQSRAGGPMWKQDSGWGSDHFPISVHLELNLEQRADAPWDG